MVQQMSIGGSAWQVERRAGELIMGEKWQSWVVCSGWMEGRGMSLLGKYNLFDP